MSNENQQYTIIKAAMLLHMPFFASLLLDIMDVRIDDYKDKSIFPPGMRPTMATDGRVIYIDENFIRELPVEQAVFVVCHEIAHAMWEHLGRGKQYIDLGFDGDKFNPMLWNFATDFVINDMLDKAKAGKMPVDKDSGKAIGLLDPKYTCDMTGEEVYRDLLKNGLPKSCQGSGQTPGDGTAGMDGHIFNPDPINAAELKRAIQSAVDGAKAVGKLPGALERFADELLSPQITWQELLRTTVVTTAARDTRTWARPHRRRLASQGIYLSRPSAFGCDDIVVAVDTSGSIGQKELTVFFSELADIIRTCKPERVWVFGVDSAVATVEELPGDVDITSNPPKVGGGGGTDFRPAFAKVEELQITPDAFVYFTDLQGPGPDEEPGYPVIWCSTTPELQGKIGRTIYVKIDP